MLLLMLSIYSINVNSQVDSLHYEKTQKDNRFKVAGRVITNSIITIPGDFSEMGHSISKNWTTTGLYAAGTLALIASDYHTTVFLQDYIEPAIDYTLPEIDPFTNNPPWLGGEDAYISYPLIALYAGSFIANSEKGQRAAANAFKSMAYSFVISHLFLKSVISRKRPDAKLSGDAPAEYPYTKDHWDFGYYHGVTGGTQQYGTAMPSLHATAYYAVAKVIQMEYDNYWLPYGFVTFVFMANFSDHRHWVSDMLVGGLIGTIIGRSVVLNSRKHIEKTQNEFTGSRSKKIQIKKQLLPQISSKGVGLHFIASF